MTRTNSSKDRRVLRARSTLRTLAESLERMRIAEYVSLLQNPRRLFLLNFLGGIARGLGTALGATLLLALLVMILRGLLASNLPIIGGFIADLVRIVLRSLNTG
ncbi:MAG: hypothetical protein HYY09_06665 [Firmicutes bacterium]|nr:hypothetical protein [Bacillota bacterium]